MIGKHVLKLGQYLSAIPQCVGAIRWKLIKWKPTRRGNKAGRRFYRPIQTVLTYRTSPLLANGVDLCVYKQAGCNMNNLVTLPRAHMKATDTHCPLNLTCLNVRSVKNKTLSLCDYIISNSIDILAVTETWLGSVVDATVLSELIPTGYDINHVPRQSTSTGGGIAVIFKVGIKLSVIESSISKVFTHFEYMDCRVTVNGNPLYLSVIYRPPPSKTNGLKNHIFFDEWASYLERFTEIQQNILITGDLNFHLDDEKDADSKKFISLLEGHGLSQHVQGATHKKGHTLDLVITHSGSTLLKATPIISNPGLCDKHGKLSGDHFAVICTVNLQRPSLTKRSVSFRALRKIDVSDFKLDITESDILKMKDKPLDELLESYNNGLQKLLDKHAPLQHKCITLRPHARGTWMSYAKQSRNVVIERGCGGKVN